MFGNFLCSNKTQALSIILVQLTNNFPQFSYPINTYKQNLITALSGDYIFKRFEIARPCEYTAEYRWPCVTLTYVEIWHIFGILKYSESFRNCVLTQTQNPAIFTKISKPCVTLEIQNHRILTILEYSEPWHI